MLAHRRIIRRAIAVAYRRPIDTKYVTYRQLAHFVSLTYLSNSLSPNGRRYHVLECTSFRRLELELRPSYQSFLYLCQATSKIADTLPHNSVGLSAAFASYEERRPTNENWLGLSASYTIQAGTDCHELLVARWGRYRSEHGYAV
jgi:hypothetical protein